MTLAGGHHTLEVMDSRIPKELQRKLFELTLALYRVTDFFPPGEALRKHLREKANEVFGLASEYGFSPDADREAIAILSKVESIKGYICIARSLRFVKPLNLTILEREYDSLAGFFAGELNAPKQEAEENAARPESKEELPTWHEFAGKTHQKSEKDKKSGKVIHPLSDMSNMTKDAKIKADEALGDITERQKKILEYIHKTSQAKISDFYSFFNDLSSKTIQRDLQDLVSRNILKKEGDKRWTVYSLNHVS